MSSLGLFTICVSLHYISFKYLHTFNGAETAWYKTVETDYGILLDTRHTYTKSDWEIWTSAIVTDTSVRDSLISGVLKYAMDGKSNQPLSDWYDTNDGSVEGFRARPVVGGHLALVSYFCGSGFRDLSQLWRASFLYDHVTVRTRTEEFHRYSYASDEKVLCHLC